MAAHKFIVLIFESGLIAAWLDRIEMKTVGSNAEIVTNKGFYPDYFIKMWLLILSSQVLGAGAIGSVSQSFQH
jgi:hypothetical protein